MKNLICYIAGCENERPAGSPYCKLHQAARPGILSPEEWLYENVFTASQKMAYKQGLFPVYSGEQAAKYMLAYAAYVSAHVHQETLHRAAGLTREYAGQPARMRKEILDIPLQDVYPAEEKTETL